MTNLPNAEDEDWNYLSNVLASNNGDEDLIDAPDSKERPRKVQNSGIEAQIQNLVDPDTPLATISGMRVGKVHVHGKFSQASGRYLRQGLHITEAVITDDTGSARVVWFNQPYKAQSIRRDTIYELRGNFALSRQRLQINNANIRPLSEGCAPFERKSIK